MFVSPSNQNFFSSHWMAQHICVRTNGFCQTGEGCYSQTGDSNLVNSAQILGSCSIRLPTLPFDWADSVQRYTGLSCSHPLLPNKVFAALFTLPLYREKKSGLPKSVNGVETSCLRRRIDAEHYAGEHGKQQAQQNNVSSHGKRRLQEKSSCE